jgi:GAF domain-containing protein
VSTFDEITVTIFRSLAAQLAVGILEGQTYAAEQQRAEQLATLAQVSRTVTSQLSNWMICLTRCWIYWRSALAINAPTFFLAHPDRLVFCAGLGRGAERWSSGEYHLHLDGTGLIALAARTPPNRAVNDVTAHADYLSGFGLDDTRSEMAAPMVMAGRLLGVFDVQSEQLNAYSLDDEQILQTLADTLAVAIRNARLFEAERRRRRLAEILREVSAALTATLQLDDVLDLILNGLDRVVSYDVASILLVNEPGEITLRAIRGLSDTQGLIGLQLDVRLFEPGEAFPATLSFEEVDHQREYHELLSLPDPHTCLGAVLALPHEHLGYLVVDRASANGFAPEEKELIAAFASQAAVAIQNARLYTAQREQAWMSTALVQVAEATGRSTELKDVLETVAKLTPMLVGVDRCAVLLAEGDSFAVKAYDSLDTAILLPSQSTATLPERLRPEQWPGLAEVIATQSPVVLDPDQPMPVELRPLFTGVVILLPLLARGRVEGALAVGQVPGEVPFTTDRIASSAASPTKRPSPLKAPLLYQSLQEEARVSTALLQVAEALAGQPLETGLRP